MTAHGNLLKKANSVGLGSSQKFPGDAAAAADMETTI